MIVEAAACRLDPWIYSGELRPRYYWWAQRIAAAHQVRAEVARRVAERKAKGSA